MGRGSHPIDRASISYIPPQKLTSAQRSLLVDVIMGAPALRLPKTLDPQQDIVPAGTHPCRCTHNSDALPPSLQRTQRPWYYTVRSLFTITASGSSWLSQSFQTLTRPPWVCVIGKCSLRPPALTFNEACRRKVAPPGVGTWGLQLKAQTPHTVTV